jgi:hypothetical protein
MIGRREFITPLGGAVAAWPARRERAAAGRGDVRSGSAPPGVQHFPRARLVPRASEARSPERTLLTAATHRRDDRVSSAMGWPR